MRDSNIIIKEIEELLDELGGSLNSKISVGNVTMKTKSGITPPKGAFGAISMLMAENFFDSPKEISTVLNKLKEVGHYHKPTAIAMNLLNLTKRRVLNRFQNKETKNWEYVIRK